MHTRPVRPILTLACLGLLLTQFVLGAGCSYRSEATRLPGELPAPRATPYEVRVGDVVELRFFNVPSLDQTRVVGPDGEIGLLLVGQVNVAGRTLGSLTQELTELYKQDLVNPELSLAIQEFSALSVHVGGEVANPGVVPYWGGLTVTQAIMAAGGFSGTARLTEVLVIRRGPNGQPVAAVANVEQVLKNARFEDDIPLTPLDLVFVPRSRIADVNKFMNDYIYNNLPYQFMYFFGDYRR